MRRWFRICLEAPDDGAGGGTDVVEEAQEEEFHGAFTQQGWQGDPAVADEPAEPVADEPDAPADGTETTAPAAERPEGWTDSDWADFQKQFPGGTQADLWKHYSELRTRFSRGEHKQPEPAAEPEAEPEPEEPASWRAHNFSSLGAIPTDGLSAQQRTELSELMQLDPKAAAHWAVANAELVSEDEFAAIQNNWYATDPWGAKRYWDAAQEQVREERQAEELGPRMAVVDAQQQVQGRDLAFQAFPLMQEQRQAFGEWIEQNPQIDDQLSQMTEPTQIRDALVTLFNAWYTPKALERLHEVEAAEAARLEAEKAAEAEQAVLVERQQRGARTATRTAPATPAGGEASADDIRAAIRAAPSR